MGTSGPDRVAAVRRMVAAHLPGYRVDTVVHVGEGLDHLAYEVNGELIVRWSKEPDRAARAAAGRRLDAGVHPQRPRDRARPVRPGQRDGDRHHRLERCRHRGPGGRRRPAVPRPRPGREG